MVKLQAVVKDLKPYYTKYDLRYSRVVVMKSTIFWDITLCSPLKVNQSFRALLATCFYSGIFLRLFFGPEDGGDVKIVYPE
jgi:hypothetical protein